jgi:very-short-patch-repair endonuclease
LKYSELDSVLVRTEKVLESINNIVPLHIKAAELFIQLLNIEERRRHSVSILSEKSRKQSSICISAIYAIHEKNTDLYEKEYLKLFRLFEKYTLQEKRINILNRIEYVAPAWAAAVDAREGIHGSITCPENIEQAWQWKQFTGIIEEITAEPFEELQNKSVLLSKELKVKTAELAANQAWYHLLTRTEQNIELKQALIGWKLTIKKIGKGTGKNAPALRRQARELMAKCQVAVSAWIMPVNKALESLDPSKNSFDVVIVDEASQSDISALAILYLGKKIIIVGDDKQVSPMAVGIDIDRMNALREMYIKNTIANWHLYDAKTSLYDIAGTTYPSLMLREHFRCVPEIIGYSNKLSYDFKIKPLRDGSNCVVTPPVISYRIENGQRKGKLKINIQEAETVVSLMMACIEQPEYAEKTFGVISLLGDDQAKIIQQKIFEEIEPSTIEEKRILCGNASHFQGDQRDIIFLSMVDSNEGDGPLRLSGEGADQSTKQRYNVATSRAKDQLWIIHSLDYSKDLKSGDIRRDLLEYADNPKAYTSIVEAIKAKAESPFEEAVAKSLVADGYNITQQWEVGSYRIDMVVQYNKIKIAVECDGEQYHSGEEKVREDMERQTILERLGWQFVRIRGSEYYRDPEMTMTRVKSELNKRDIFPENSVEPLTKTENFELLSHIKIRAAQIIRDWHSEDAEIDDSDNMTEKFPTDRTKQGAIPVEPAKQDMKTLELKQYQNDVQISIDQIEKSASNLKSNSLFIPNTTTSRSSNSQNKKIKEHTEINQTDNKNTNNYPTKKGEDILNCFYRHILSIDRRVIMTKIYRTSCQKRVNKKTSERTPFCLSGQFSFNDESNHVVIYNFLVLLLAIDQAVCTGFINQSRTSAGVFVNLGNGSI